MSSTDSASLRLRAIIKADPGALIRLLQLFQVRNVCPHRVRASQLGGEFIEAEIELDATGTTIAELRQIAAKARELPITLTAVVLD